MRFAFKPSVDRLEEERDSHTALRIELEKNANIDMQTLHEELYRSLGESGLLDDSYLAQELASMKNALYGMPDILLVSPLYVAYDHFKNICIHLFKIRQLKPIQNLVKIRFSQNLQEKIIDKFREPEAFFKLMKHDEIATWHGRSKRVYPAWVAWDILMCLEWSMHTKRSTSTINANTDKDESYRETRDDVRRVHLCSCYAVKPTEFKRCGSKLKCEKSEYHLYLHCLRRECAALQGRINTKRPESALFMGEITTALGDKLDHQSIKDLEEVEINDGLHFFSQANIKRAFRIIKDDCGERPPSNAGMPHAISIDIHDEVNVVLEIEWVPGLTEICLLHKFSKEEGKEFNFIDALINDPGQMHEIPKGRNAVHAKRYLKHANITGVIAELFVGYCKGREAKLIGKRVMLAHQSEEFLTKLRNTVMKLETIRWE